jgi:outer membrane protein TolC
MAVSVRVVFFGLVGSVLREVTMTGTTRRRGVGAAAVALVAAVPFFVPAAADDVREVVIGVVRDGPHAGIDLVPSVERELAGHLRPDVHMVLREGFEGDWTAAGADRALRAAIADPAVDLMLVTGALGGQAAVRIDPLVKPVLSCFVTFDGMIDEPIRDGRSAKANLSFITLGHRIRRDLETFRDLVGFGTVHVAVSPGEIDALSEVRTRIAEYEHEIGIRIVPVEVARGADDPAAGFGPDVEAVYVAPITQLSPTERDRLFERLAARGIPTWSMFGAPDVERGALATLTPDWTEQVVRRAALNLSRVIQGETTSDLPVLLAVDTQLAINADTAARIGWIPSADIRLSAVWVSVAPVEPDVERLTLGEAMRLAEQGNTALTVSDAVVAGAEEDQYRARSGLLPQLLADVSYEKADIESFGDAEATRGGLVLHQTIYDDAQWSAYNSSKRVYDGATLRREADRLDVLAAAARSFLSFALAEALYRVEIDNLAITRSNLELARLRREVGHSGREEILRWESQLAQDQGNVLLAEQDVETARIALNQILGLDQRRRWIPLTREVDETVFPWIGGRLDQVFDDVASRRALSDALVGHALETTPDLAADEREIEAQEIQVDRLRRSYFVPSVAADLAWSDAFGGSGPALIVPQDENWSVRVGASYPILSGGRRKHDLARAHADLDGLERRQTFTREIVEQDARTALRRCEGSFPRIALSRRSAGNATENLELVRDRYAEGLVNVTDLLDAQGQKLISDRLATTSAFEFELDLIDLERAVAWFETDHDEVAAADFVRAIEARVASGVNEESNP